MFRQFRTSWQLLRTSMNVLGEEKMLLVFPVAGGIMILVVLAAFAVGIWHAGLWESLRTC